MSISELNSMFRLYIHHSKKISKFHS